MAKIPSEIVLYLFNLNLLVFYIYIPGRPGCWTLPNGDPGYPPEPPELDLLSVIDMGITKEILPILLADQINQIEIAILQSID